MEFSKLLNPSSKLNIILIISFSISVNSFILFPNFNNVFYIFYHYHYYLYVVALIYGILFDILLLNNIGAHLISFLSLLILFVLLRKYLIRLSAYQIVFTYFLTLIILLIIEQFFANLILFKNSGTGSLPVSAALPAKIDMITFVFLFITFKIFLVCSAV